MRTSVNALLLALLAALLQACGGGGTSYERDNAVVINPSQTDVLNMAKLGALYNSKLADFYTAHIRFAANYLQTFAVLNTGSTTDVGLACTGGGTVDVKVTKTGTYLGLQTGDTVEATFKQCMLSDANSPVVMGDGKLKVTANADINTPNAANQLKFTVEETDLSVTLGTVKTRGNLSLTVAPRTLTSTDFNYQYTGNSATKLEFFEGTAAAPAIAMTHSTAVGSVSESASTRAYAASGVLSISAAGSSIGFALTTDPVMSGPVPVSGKFIPTTGVYRMENFTGFTKLSVKVTAGSTKATVNGYYNSIVSGTPDTTTELDNATLYP